MKEIEQYFHEVLFIMLYKWGPLVNEKKTPNIFQNFEHFCIISGTGAQYIVSPT